MLVKTYGYSLHLNAETTKKKIIYSIDPEIHSSRAPILKDNPILDSVSRSIYGKQVHLSKIHFPDALNEEEFNLYHSVEDKIITLQDIFYDLHEDIPYGLYKLDDIIVSSINDKVGSLNVTIDIQLVLKAGLMVKGMVLLNQGKELPDYIEKVIENYNARRLLES